ncbi:hypothetical protein JCM8208_006822 [Rhodotorula glutinis]
MLGTSYYEPQASGSTATGKRKARPTSDDPATRFSAAHRPPLTPLERYQQQWTSPTQAHRERPHAPGLANLYGPSTSSTDPPRPSHPPTTTSDPTVASNRSASSTRTITASRPAPSPPPLVSLVADLDCASRVPPSASTSMQPPQDAQDEAASKARSRWSFGRMFGGSHLEGLLRRPSTSTQSVKSKSSGESIGSSTVRRAGRPTPNTTPPSSPEFAHSHSYHALHSYQESPQSPIPLEYPTRPSRKLSHSGRVAAAPALEPIPGSSPSTPAPALLQVLDDDLGDESPAELVISMPQEQPSPAASASASGSGTPATSSGSPGEGTSSDPAVVAQQQQQQDHAAAEQPHRPRGHRRIQLESVPASLRSYPRKVTTPSGRTTLVAGRPLSLMASLIDDSEYSWQQGLTSRFSDPTPSPHPASSSGAPSVASGRSGRSGRSARSGADEVAAHATSGERHKAREGRALQAVAATSRFSDWTPTPPASSEGECSVEPSPVHSSTKRSSGGSGVGGEGGPPPALGAQLATVTEGVAVAPHLAPPSSPSSPASPAAAAPTAIDYAEPGIARSGATATVTAEQMAQRSTTAQGRAVHILEAASHAPHLVYAPAPFVHGPRRGAALRASEDPGPVGRDEDDPRGESAFAAPPSSTTTRRRLRPSSVALEEQHASPHVVFAPAPPSPTPVRPVPVPNPHHSSSTLRTRSSAPPASPPPRPRAALPSLPAQPDPLPIDFAPAPASLSTTRLPAAAAERFMALRSLSATQRAAHVLEAANHAPQLVYAPAHLVRSPRRVASSAPAPGPAPVEPGAGPSDADEPPAELGDSPALLLPLQEASTSGRGHGSSRTGGKVAGGPGQQAQQEQQKQEPQQDKAALGSSAEQPHRPTLRRHVRLASVPSGASSSQCLSAPVGLGNGGGGGPGASMLVERPLSPMATLDRPTRTPPLDGPASRSSELSTPSSDSPPFAAGRPAPALRALSGRSTRSARSAATDDTARASAGQQRHARRGEARPKDCHGDSRSPEPDETPTLAAAGTRPPFSPSSAAESGDGAAGGLVTPKPEATLVLNGDGDGEGVVDPLAWAAPGIARSRALAAAVTADSMVRCSRTTRERAAHAVEAARGAAKGAVLWRARGVRVGGGGEMRR